MPAVVPGNPGWVLVSARDRALASPPRILSCSPLYRPPHSHEKTSAAEAPMNPKNGATSWPEELILWGYVRARPSKRSVHPK
eukprot:1151440-Pelagomonas_calceolata.AAC.9